MIKLRGKVAMGTITSIAAVSAFAIAVPADAHAATCTPEYYETSTTTEFNGIPVIDYFILYWIADTSQEECADYADYFFYSRFQTEDGMLLRVGSWDTNGYAYITDQTGACQLFGCDPAGIYGAKWNAYSGCDGDTNNACTSGQFATPWIPIPTGFFPPPMSGESDYNTDAGTVDPSVVEMTSGLTQRLTAAVISNKGP
jgi:hypothetical protein